MRYWSYETVSYNFFYFFIWKIAHRERNSSLTNETQVANVGLNNFLIRPGHHEHGPEFLYSPFFKSYAKDIKRNFTRVML